MKSITGLVILAIFASKSSADNDADELGIKFKKVQCWADNKLVSLHHCYIKNYSPEVASLNIAGKSLKPIDKPIDIHVIVSIGMGPMFYPVINYKLEWCAIMSGETKHIVVSMITAVVQEAMPGLLHECPYSGEYEVKNFTLDESLNLAASQFVPSGNYKVELNVMKDVRKIVNVELVVEVKSSLTDNLLAGK
jgi:hypothetical protein